MQAKAFNPQIFLEALCVSIFAVLMLYLVISGKYLAYVTPRMEPYLYFAAGVMLIWAGAGLTRLFRPQHRTRTAHCLVLAVPILLLLLPHAPVSYSNLATGYLSGSPLGGLSGTSAQSGPADTGTAAGGAPAASVPQNDGGTAALTGLDAENKTIAVSNEQFTAWLSEIFIDPQKYEGYNISLTGFVFKDAETMTDTEFVPARLMMSCCVADLTPCGIICEYDKAPELETDSWVMVEGTLKIGQYQGEDEPQVLVTKVSPAEEVEGYVYP